MRLVEGISHPSRANDQQHLQQLQKSSTKPRPGAVSTLVAGLDRDGEPPNVLTRALECLQMTLVLWLLCQRRCDPQLGRELRIALHHAYVGRLGPVHGLITSRRTAGLGPKLCVEMQRQAAALLH